MSDITGGISAEPTSATEGTLSSWYAPYATDLLDRSQALSEMDFTPYSGRLTAGPSTLQTNAFQGIGNLTVPTGYAQASDIASNVATGYGNVGTYDPTQFTTNQFNAQYAQQYMNPYLQAALDPQIREAQRAAEMKRMQDAGRLTQAGAFGGSRQAIMESEGNRNLMQNVSDILAKGYNTAYDKAADVFKSDQERALDAQKASELSRQYGAKYGLDALSGQLNAAKTLSDITGTELSAERGILQDQLAAGKDQRDIEQQGLTADYAQYLREFNYPQEQLNNYMAALKSITPQATVATNTYGLVPGAVQNAAGGAAGAQGLYDLLAGNISFEDFKKTMGIGV